MTNEDLTTEQFLAERVYLPGYMTLSNPDFGRDITSGKSWATFDFNVREPSVARGDIVHYVTPRGLHVCISQAGYAIIEHMTEEGLIENLNVDSLREILLTGRVKITELYQRFRRELGLSKPIPGKIEVTRTRLGGIMPIVKFDFDFGNRAVCGNLVSVIAPNPVPQINADLSRNPI